MATGEKILFLDFDGVIRLGPEDGGGLFKFEPRFCADRLRRLRWLCGHTGARVVVTSDWRHMESRQQMEAHLSPWLVDYLHADWSTAVHGKRWQEVALWLAAHHVDRYAILEDFRPHFEGAPAGMRDCVFWCNNRHGLVPSIVDALAAHLGAAG